MGLFNKNTKKIDDLSIPIDRQIDLNPTRQYLSWNDQIKLWEEDYFNLRKSHGWRFIRATARHDRCGDVIWQVGQVRIKAIFDKDRGIVIEKVHKR